MVDDAATGEGLDRSMRLHDLWALAVGAVISGNFQGWNYGLHVAGFGGLLTAMLPAAAMYTCLCFSLAELAALDPQAAGLHTFARHAFGHNAAFVVGFAACMEYTGAIAAIAVAIGGYVRGLCGFSAIYDPMVWTLALVFFTIVNVLGLGLTKAFTMVTTLMAMAVLMVYWCGSIINADVGRFAFTVGDGSWLPNGWSGVASALPFAIWFFLAIEELPLAQKEAVNPERDMPTALLWSLVTLAMAGVLTIFSAAASPPGANEIAMTTDPVPEGFDYIFGTGQVAKILSVLALAGLLASFHSIIYASGRQLYALAREGYLPAWLGWQCGQRHTPVVATMVASALALSVLMGLHSTGVVDILLPALLNISVCSALVTYIATFAGYLRLHSADDSKNPGVYQSPLREFGAALGLTLALLTIMCLFGNATFLYDLLATVSLLGMGLLCFAFFARHSIDSATPQALAGHSTYGSA